MSRFIATSRSFRASAVGRQSGSLVIGSRMLLPVLGARGIHAVHDPKLFGTKLFVGEVADKYLKKHGLTSSVFDDPMWTVSKADQVAAALMDWGRESGASSITHWWQPLASSGVRHGQTGQVQNTMFTFENGKPAYKFKGETLLQGETDGSSFPNGGLRGTHHAGAYTVLDPTSPIFMRGDTIFVPTIFVAWNGFALDEKTPLLRSMEALNREASRLLRLLGYQQPGVVPNIGLEQEFFLVPRDKVCTRLDLQLTGRSIMGRLSARGQEMSDHYMSAIRSNFTLQVLKEIQEECFLLGIPLRTRHREVAPNQYEVAPYFGPATQQIDQNLMVMQIADEICHKYNLSCLFHEKPFQGINGSGKHNNWSLITKDGINLLNAKQVTKASKNPLVFPILMAAIVDSVDKYGDLLRCAIASPGNDFRLGACEAPPAIISTYLGKACTDYLEKFMKGSKDPYEPVKTKLNVGASCIPPFEIPTEDRNRTSPFPYGGHRFEFRAVGASQNTSFVNIVLNTITADACKRFANAIEGGKDPHAVATEALKSGWKSVFNGNNYSQEWREEATKRGCWRIDSGVDAMNVLTKPKNIELFKANGVVGKEELDARRITNLNHYTGTVEMEAGCMIDMIKKQIVPAVNKAGQCTDGLKKSAKAVQDGLSAVHHEGDAFKKAGIARTLRLETMMKAREVCDNAEAECPTDLWPMANYDELLFLDATQDPHGESLMA